MNDFRNKMEKQSKKLLTRFSLPSPKLVKLAWSKFVNKNADVDIRADLTFKQSKEVYAAPIMGAAGVKKREWLNEDIARINIAQFISRLNYASYKHAFKRYGKKLDMVVSLEGGKGILRDNLSQLDMGKRLHAHILIQLPAHITFERFKIMILDNWYATEWGYYENNIELINSSFRSAAYQTKASFDCIDLNNTHF